MVSLSDNSNGRNYISQKPPLSGCVLFNEGNEKGEISQFIFHISSFVNGNTFLLNIQEHHLKYNLITLFYFYSGIFYLFQFIFYQFSLNKKKISISADSDC